MNKEQSPRLIFWLSLIFSVIIIFFAAMIETRSCVASRGIAFIGGCLNLFLIRWIFKHIRPDLFPPYKKKDKR